MAPAGEATPTSPGRPSTKPESAFAAGFKRGFERTYVSPLRTGVPIRDTIYWYVFVYVVVGVPLVGLFLKRGWGPTFQDGEAFLFAGSLILAVLYDHVDRCLRSASGGREALRMVFRPPARVYVIINLAALGLSVYYVVSATASAGDNADWVRILWFWLAVSYATVLPLVPAMPSDRSASEAGPESGDVSAPAAG